MLVLRELVTRLSPEKEHEFHSWSLAVWEAAQPKKKGRSAAH